MRTHVWILVFPLLAGCSDFVVDDHPAPPSTQALLGEDGALVVPGGTTVVVNAYAVLATDVAAGAASFSVTNVADLATAGLGPVGAGDLLMLIQMQGATITTTDNAAYGTVSVGGAGLYELVSVASVAGNAITVSAGCAGLDNAYSVAGHTQVVRVPQVTRLDVGNGAVVTAPAWDGSRGGVVVIHSTGAANFATTGAIDVSGLGFVGGQRDDGAPALNVAGFRSAANTAGAEKGESIAGSTTTYDSLGGRFGRGAPANGGGGGNGDRGGGGGGSNGNSGFAYDGRGVMDDDFEPGWRAEVGPASALSTSSGGGRGGYTRSTRHRDATAEGPGDTSWGGDNRRNNGGLGGHPLDPVAGDRLFFGGGGGAGDGNGGAAGNGGSGGGIVVLMAGSVDGASSSGLRANGRAGGSTQSPHNAGGGGGGGGGSIVVHAGTEVGVGGNVNGMALKARGGVGGRQLLANANLVADCTLNAVLGNCEAEGPGGAGGGGFVALVGGSAAISVDGGDRGAGGNGGTTISQGVAEFPPNGATLGGPGTLVTGAFDLPLCSVGDVAVSLARQPASVVPGQSVTWTVAVRNLESSTIVDIDVDDVFPGAVSGVTWTCTASAGSTCPGGSSTANGSGDIDARVTLLGGGTATFVATGFVDAAATGGLVNTATATTPAGQLDPVAGNNSATDSTTLVPTSDVGVTLSDNPDPVDEDGSLTFTMIVTAAGPSVATGVTATLTLPAGVVFDSATLGCNRDGLVVTCPVGSLAPGGSATLFVGVRAPDDGSALSTTAAVTSGVTDNAAANNSDVEGTTVNAQNDAPTLVLPGLQSTSEDVEIVFAGNERIAVVDVDENGGTIEVSLSAANGRLSLSRTTGLTFTTGDGDNDGSMVFTGTLAAINAALDGLRFGPTPDTSGVTAVSIVVDDGGNTGAGGAQRVAGSVTIDVAPVNDPPNAVNDSFNVLTDGGAQVLDVARNDSGAPDVGETLTVTAVGTAQNGVVVVGTGVDSGVVRYTPAAGFTGVDAFTYTIADDDGVTDTATVSLIVSDDPNNGDDDLDDDGVDNGAEAVAGTNPLDPDSDDDGVGDAAEIGDPADPTDSDGDDIIDALDGDDDGDGILTVAEVRDGQEQGDDDPDGDNLPAFLDLDSDGDTVPDEIEGRGDRDGDGVPNYLDKDSDGDGDPDEDEGAGDDDGDGIANFLDDDDNDGPDGDTDDDGLDNDVEDAVGTDAEDADSDGDSLGDADEIGDPADPTDTDGDGVIDPNDADDDGDGIGTGTEVADGADVGDNDVDDDGLPNHLDTDADGDGFGDGDEGRGDADDDGVPAYLDDDEGLPAEGEGEGEGNEGEGEGEGNEGEGEGNDDADGDGIPDDLEAAGGGCHGCSSSTGADAVPFLAVLGLLVLRRRRALAASAVLVGLLLTAPAARAQVGAFSVERFHPTVDSRGFLDVDSGTVGEHGQIDGGVVLGYAANPLVLYDKNGQRVGSLVGNRLHGSFTGALSLFDWVQLGIEVPVVLFQNRDLSQVNAALDKEDPLLPSGVGDVRLAPRLRVFRVRDGVFADIALQATLGVPTGFPKENYFSDNQITFTPAVLISRDIGDVTLAGNLSWVVRPEEAEAQQLVVGQEVIAEAGVKYSLSSLLQMPVSLDAAVRGGTYVADPFRAWNQVPVELLAGGAWRITDVVELWGGGGVGVVSGFGVPDARALVGLRYVPPPGDQDHDGIFDRDDACVQQPEDKDGFEDSDGCPEDDNDRDGIRDDLDECKDVPEDRDGHEDWDGCPDNDNDGDGVVDGNDTCREVPEDKDGFEDEDGCPEADNDKDGVADREDKCPNEAGIFEKQGCPSRDRDKDGIEDEVDDCPDVAGLRVFKGCADRDKDGIPDPADQCPDQPETINGVDDEDGCPDQGESKVRITATKVEILEKVFFEFDKASLQGDRSNDLLNQVSALLRANPQVTRIRIEGHTDDKGNDGYNLELSQARAETVRTYLVGRGIDLARLDAVGFGETRPIDSNKKEAGRDRNRRVEFTIVDVDGKPMAP